MYRSRAPGSRQIVERTSSAAVSNEVEKSPTLLSPNQSPNSIGETLSATLSPSPPAPQRTSNEENNSSDNKEDFSSRVVKMGQLIEDHIRKREWDKIADVVYEVLKCAINKDHYKLIIDKICGSFDVLEQRLTISQDVVDVLNTVGFVLLHLLQRASNGADFGRSIIKISTTSNQLLSSPFRIALLLSLVQISRFRDDVLQSFKSILTRFFKEEEKRFVSCWLNRVLPDVPDLHSSLMPLLESKSSELNDVISGGLCELGFILLDSNLSKVQIVSGHLLHDDSTLSPNQAACELGKWILEQCVKNQTDSCGPILEKLLQAILDHGTKDSAFYYIDLLSLIVSQFKYEVLLHVSKVREVLEHVPLLDTKVATSLMKSVLPVVKLKPELRDNLLTTLKKAMFARESESRKVAVCGFLLFLKHFKFMPKQAPVLPTQQLSQSFPTFSSQILRDVNPTAQSQRTYDALCLEAIGCLKRCFSQRAEVRTLLYKGLCQAAYRNPYLLDPITDMLFHQLSLYVQWDDNQAPLRLDSVVFIGKERVVCMEPLAQLLQALLQCVRFQAEQERKLRNETSMAMSQQTSFLCSQTVEPEQTSSQNDERINLDEGFTFDKELYSKVKRTLVFLAKRIADTDLVDFALDKTADYSHDSNDGSKNAHLAFCLLYTYDALLEICIWLVISDRKPESAECINNILEKRNKLQDVLREKNVTLNSIMRKKADVGTKKVSPFIKKTSTSGPVIQMITINRALEKLLIENQPSWDECLRILRHNPRLMSWLFENCLEKVKLCREQLPFEGVAMFSCLCKLGSLMLKFYSGSEEVVEHFSDEDDPLKWTAIQIYSKLIDVINTIYPDKLQDALLYVCNSQNQTTAGESESLESLCWLHFATVAKPVKKIIDDEKRRRDTEIVGGAGKKGQKSKQKDAKDSREKHFVALIQIWSNLAKRMPIGSIEFEKAFKNTETLCLGYTVDELNSVKELWKFYLSIHIKKHEMKPENLLLVAQNLRKQISEGIKEKLLKMKTKTRGASRATAELEEYTVPQPSKVYAGITSKSATIVYQLLCLHLDMWINSTKHSVGALRTISQNGERMKSQELDREIHRLLAELTNVVAELCACQLAESPAGDAKIKTVTNYYEALQLYAQYHMNAVAKLKGVKCENHFRTLMSQVADQVSITVDNEVGYRSIDDDDSSRGTGGRDKGRQLGRIMKEGKMYVSMTRAKESFEGTVLLIAKQTDDSKLMRCLKKVGISRDFKIHANIVKNLLREDRQIQLSDEDGEGNDDVDESRISVASTDSTQRRKRPASADVSTGLQKAKKTIRRS